MFAAPSRFLKYFFGLFISMAAIWAPSVSAQTYSFTALGPTTFTTNQLRGDAVRTQLLVNGVGSGNTYSSIYSGAIIAGQPNDVNGIAGLGVGGIGTNSPFAVVVSVGCPSPTPLNCPPSPITFTVTNESVSLTPITTTATIPSGGNASFEARYGSASFVNPGISVIWAITSSPTGGNGSFVSRSNITDPNGRVQAVFTATVPGTYVINVSDPSNTFITDRSETFTVLVTGRTLSVASGDGQSGTVNTALALPLAVAALDNGSIIPPSVAINWTTSAGTLASGSSLTDAGTGIALNTLTLPATPGPVTITATRSDDGTAIASFTATANAAVAGTSLAVFSGDAQSATVGATLPQPLVVLAQNNLVNLPNATIIWTTTAGTLSATSSVTDSAGLASIGLSLPTTPGTITVTARRADNTAIVAQFTITATAVNTYAFTLINNQSSYITNQLVPLGGFATILLVNGGGSGNTYSTDFVDTSNNTSFGVIPNGANGIAGINIPVSDVVGTRTLEARVVCPQPTPTGCPPTPVSISVTNEAVALTAVSPSTVNLVAGQSTVLIVRYGSASFPAPAGYSFNWSFSTGTVTNLINTDASGNAQATFTAGTTPGTYTITANANAVNPNIIDRAETFTIIISAAAPTISAVNDTPAAILSTGGNTPSVIANDTTNGVAAVIGTNVSLIPGTSPNPGLTMNADGTITVAAGTAGGSYVYPYTICTIPATTPTATCSTANSTVVVTAVVINRTLATASPATGAATANAGSVLPLSVLAQDNAVNATNVTINWTTSAGTLSAASSVTAATGLATVSLTLPATGGTVTVTGTRADNNLAIATFTITSTLVRTLAIVSGNGQSGPVGSTLAAPLVVVANNNGTAATNVLINWTISTGSSLGAAATTTNVTGQASNTATLGLTPGAVTITATRQDDPAVSVSFTVNNVLLAGIPNLSPQQGAIAGALDAGCAQASSTPNPTPAQQDFIQRCLDLAASAANNPGDVTTALQELLPDTQVAQSNASLATASRQFEIISSRIATLRSGAKGTDLNAFMINGPNGGGISLGSIVKGLNADEVPTTEEGSDFQRWGFFLSGSIGRGDSDGTSLTPRYNFDLNSLTAGLDYRYSDNIVLGAALGYNQQNTHLALNQGGLDASAYTLSAYGSYFRNDNWYTDASLTFGKNNYDLVRRITYTLGSSTVNQTARAESGGDQVSLGLTFGRDFQTAGWSIGPYGRVLYSKLNFDRIQERLISTGAGAGLALIVEERSLDSLASVLGTKFVRSFSRDWGVLTPNLQVEWEHEFKSDPGAAVARFVNDPTGTPIILKDAPTDSDFFRIGLGLSAIMSKGRSGFVYYDKVIGRQGITQDNLTLGLRIEF
jgi:uncharacterized protein with beta-barrel porin domain